VNILFIGAGNMGGAILKGLALSNDVQNECLGILDSNENLVALRQQETGCTVFTDLGQALQWANMALLCIKPQGFSQLASEIVKHTQSMPAATKSKLCFVSIMAGITLHTLQQALNGFVVVRTMPNIPLSVGKGAVAISTDGVASETLTNVQSVFSPVGACTYVSESQMNAVTALSGSGPAFIFEFMESLIQGGIKSGLSRAQATEFIINTMGGCVQMLKELNASPDTLSAMVTSPGGTTIFGLHELAKGGFKASVMNAIESACKRSEELGK
jgi:pyrroline-5-carboxylate reductase